MIRESELLAIHLNNDCDPKIGSRLQTRRNFLKLGGAAAIGAALSISLPPRIVSAEQLGDVLKQTDYNECEPSDVVRSLIGTRIANYCDGENGDYTTTIKPGLAADLRETAAVLGVPIFAASDSFHDIGLNLAGALTIFYNSRAEEDKFHFAWSVGELNNPFGTMRTLPFSEQKLNSIDYLSTYWVNSQMSIITFIDRTGNELLFPYHYTHNIRRTSQTQEPSESGLNQS